MASFLQSTAWQKFQESAGTRTEWQDGLLYLRRSFGFGTYWQCSRFAAGSFAVPPFAQGSAFLRLEPEDDASLEIVRQFSAAQRLRLEPTVANQPRQTLILDIGRPIEEVLAGFKPKHRYNYGVSQRSLLQSEVHSRLLAGDLFGRFWNLMRQTADRQGFRTHSEHYYREMLATLETEGMAHLVFIRRDTEDLAAMILITHDGTATYLHGASSPQYREAMAPYFMHISAIQLAQSLGMARYDFWGIDAELVDGEWKPKEGAASAGTTKFKLGFGGEVVQYPGCFDLVARPFWYALYKSVRRLRGGKRAFA